MRLRRRLPRLGELARGGGATAGAGDTTRGRDRKPVTPLGFPVAAAAAAARRVRHCRGESSVSRRVRRGGEEDERRGVQVEEGLFVPERLSGTRL